MKGPTCPRCPGPEWFPSPSAFNDLMCKSCGHKVDLREFRSLAGPPPNQVSGSGCDSCNPRVTRGNRIPAELKIIIQADQEANIFGCADCGFTLYRRKPRLERPLLTNYLVGWRRWKLDRGSGLLRSPWDSTPWLPKQAYEATCNPRQTRHSYQHGKDVEDGHECPHKDCSCGVYAFREPQLEWLDHALKNNEPYGLVAIWGIVIEHELGWRGQYGYPLKVYWSEPQRYPALELYEVGIETIDSTVIMEHFAKNLSERDRILLMKAIAEKRREASTPKYKWTKTS